MKNLLSLIISIAVVCVQAVFAAKQSVAVLPSEGEVFNASQLKFFTDKAQEIAVRALPKSEFEVFPQDVIIKRLGGVDNYFKECKESSCIVELGRKAMVDYITQCSFGKLGSDLTVTFELYQVSTSGLIDKFVDKAKNINGLLAIMQKEIPNSFMKIPGAAPEAKTALPSVVGEAGASPKAKTALHSVDGEISGGMFTDRRDGQKYRVVKIGTQTWMAENLNYDASGSKCYNNNSGYCQYYGRLYDWSTAKKACPSGWHLPSNAEWNVLMVTVGGTETAGKKLKAKSGWNNNGNGTDEFGFSALPGGYGYDRSYGYFNNVGEDGYWWSASENSSRSAYGRYMAYRYEGADWSYYVKSSLYSVRCVRD